MKHPDLIIIPSNNEPSAKMVQIACKNLYPNAEVVIALDVNRNGKGWAIRRALYESTRKDVVVFIDGDFDINPLFISDLLEYIDDYDIVIAEKDVSDLTLKRKIISIGYRFLIKTLFRMRVNDTQTGLKLWKWYALSDFTSDGFSYDIELLAQAHKKGMRIKSVPIKVNIDKKVRLVQIWRTFKETIKVWLALSFQDTMKI